MPVELPTPFAMKDLFLDVDLTACMDGTSYDFSGKKTFNTQFYRDNIGFGITNINVEINPSLQPLVEITFKDLYGNTIFGTQKGTEIDYSILFNWPPPKFLFSFKGYLGRKVTWILNLKRHDVSFNSSDGSYSITCSFVPNQWGFFSDVPFLYLLATKYLRREYYTKLARSDSGEKKLNICNEGGVDAPKTKTDMEVLSTFDLVKIGRQLELKTKEETKEFDEIRKQMTDAKYTACQSLYKTDTLELNRAITGEVNGIQISNGNEDAGLTFTPILFESKAWGDLDEDTIKTLLKLPTEVAKLNTYMLLKMKVGLTKDGSKTIYKSLAGADKITWKNTFAGGDNRWKDTSPGGEGEKVRDVKKIAIKYLDDNLILIEKEIQRRIFNTSKYQLSKMTISQVFSQIARDSAFILGLIIENGLKGYQAAKNRRDELDGTLIGKSFPLVLKDGTGEELPATKENLGENIEVENHELLFVKNFIDGITQGIAENLVNNSTAISDENKLVKRINNMEAPKGNPYRPFYKNIAENILIRSGIVAFITRSNDPNKPGSYYNTYGSTNDADWNNIATLAKADLENISDSLITSLSFLEKRKLMRFCKFFDRLLDEDGVEFLDYFGTSTNTLSNYGANYSAAVSDRILDYEVVMSDFNKETVRAENPYLTSQNQYEIVNELRDKFGAENVETLTIRQLLLNELLGKESPGSIKEFVDTDGYPNVNPVTGKQVKGDQYSTIYQGQFDDAFSNTSYIDTATLTATCLKNNGLYYCYPNVPAGYGQGSRGGAPDPPLNSGTGDEEPYWVVVFEGGDATKALEAQNAASDGEFASEEEYDRRGGGRFTEIVGVVPIESIYQDGVGSDYKQRVVTLNNYVEKQVAISHTAAKRLLKRPSEMSPADVAIAGITGNYSLDQFRWDKLINKSTKIAFAAYGHQDPYPGGIIWAPFAAQNPEAVLDEIALDLDLGGGLEDAAQQAIDESNGAPGRGNAILGRNNFPANQRAYIKTMCKGILERLEEIEEKKNQVLGELFGRASEQENLIYKQMHHIFHQWYTVIGSNPDNPCGDPGIDLEGLAVILEKQYGGCNKHFAREPNSDLEKVVELDGGSTYFVYDYPLQHMTGTNVKGSGGNETTINAAHSIINIDPLMDGDANTTVLNMIQQLCTKNNFIFVPFPGDIGATSVADVYKPYSLLEQTKIINHFHVMFSPTPESRSLLSNNKFKLGDFTEQQKDFAATAINIQFGSIYNQIVKNLSVGTEETKPTAESIVNLQRLVDNENQNKQVTTDCSMLSVMEGRSYKAKCEILGNSQIYPMQFFYLDKMPLFSGLYQIMKVSHSISPNDMTTNFEGIRMRFTPNNKYGGVPPITYEDYEKLGGTEDRRSFSFSALSVMREAVKKINDEASGTAGGATSGADITRLDLTKPVSGPIAAASSPSPVSVAGMSLYPSGQPYLSGKPIGDDIDCVKLGHDFTESASGILANQAIAPHLLALIRDAKLYLKSKNSSTEVFFSSGFRSFEGQANCRIWNLKSEYRKKIFSWTGSKYQTADKTIINQTLYDEIIIKERRSSKSFLPATATPGWSKHQTGIAFDISAAPLGFKGPPSLSMGGYDLYEWLIGNAHRYGFIRTVSSEGWHWEYRPGWGVFNGVKRNHSTWLGIPDKLAAKEPEFQVSQTPSYKRHDLANGMIVTVPSPKPDDGYDVLFVYGGADYANPEWMLEKIPENKKLQYLFVIIPYNLPYFMAKSNYTTFAALKSLRSKTNSICGFSKGGIQVMKAANSSFRMVGLIDPSVDAQQLGKNKFGGNTILYYGSSAMEAIFEAPGANNDNPRLYTLLSEEVEQGEGYIEKIVENHDYFAEQFFQRFI